MKTHHEVGTLIQKACSLRQRVIITSGQVSYEGIIERIYASRVIKFSENKGHYIKSGYFLVDEIDNVFFVLADLSPTFS